jgi:hypothetical protein
MRALFALAMPIAQLKKAPDRAGFTEYDLAGPGTRLRIL